MSQTILVTGGAGYIGSHTCKALARAGYTPVTLDNLSRGFSWSVKWGPLEKADIADASAVRRIVEKHKPLAAIHFAAYAYVSESVSDPGLYYENNVVGSLHLTRALLEAGVNKLVFSSTCATYGIPSALPIRETSEQKPVNPYGATKLMIERILADFDQAHGLRSVSLRYFNASGADRDGEIGEAHDPETHLIPLVLQAAFDATRPVSVMGQDYDTPDGTAIRDYVHVEDLAQAHLKALEYLLDGGATTACNVGTGKGATVMEVIRAAEAATGRKVAWKAAPRRAGDPPALFADPSRLKDLLGLEPSAFASLEDIMSSAAAWYVKHTGLKT
jgi:UDP-glucose-4-epimerase GalE